MAYLLEWETRPRLEFWLSSLISGYATLIAALGLQPALVCAYSTLSMPSRHRNLNCLCRDSRGLFF